MATDNKTNLVNSLGAPTPEVGGKDFAPSNNSGKSLHYSIIDGCADAVKIGFGDNRIGLFALFLKANNTLIGLLTAFPLLVGAITQLISLSFLDRVSLKCSSETTVTNKPVTSRKSLIILGVLVQSVLWLPIFICSLSFPRWGPVLLIGLFSLYAAAGNFTVPAWSSLMGDLVEPNKRGDYFGQRNRLIAVFAFGATLISGLILNYWEQVNEWIGFGIIFGMAFIAKLVSAYYLNKMTEPSYRLQQKDCFSLWDFIRRSPKSNFARFVFYTALINFAVAMSGPYFIVYMRRGISLSYAQIVVAEAANIATQFFVMRYWGRLGDRFGNKKILTLTGFLIAFVPMLWLLSPSLYWIIVCQICAGIVWSGFSLAAGNFIFDAVSPAKRARCVAYYTLINNTFMFFGAITGGIISSYLPDSITFLGFSFPLVSSLLFLFLLSGLTRLFVSSVFIPFIREVRPVEPISTWSLLFLINPLRPIFSSMIDIFTGVGRDENNQRK